MKIETDDAGTPWHKKGYETKAEIRQKRTMFRKLLVRSLKWIRRLEERKDDIPNFFDAHTSPTPLRKSIEEALGIRHNEPRPMTPEERSPVEF